MTIKDTYTACSVVEEFADFTPTEEQYLQAWSHLIKTGACWSLQGWYGRNASHMIREGYISKDGQINWELINQEEGY